MLINTLSDFIFEFVTDLFYVAPLVPIVQQKRHFPVFVACVQLLASLVYNFMDALRLQTLFIRKDNWHFISDTLTLTYGLLLIVHLCVEEDEDKNIMLRYFAFFLSWIFKYRDAWDSARYETLLVVAYLIVLVVSHVQNPDRRYKLKQRRLSRGVLAAFAALFMFVLAESRFRDPFNFSLGLAHAFSGYAAFELWSCNNVNAVARGGGMRASGTGGGSSSFV